MFIYRADSLLGRHRFGKIAQKNKSYPKTQDHSSQRISHWMRGRRSSCHVLHPGRKRSSRGTDHSWEISPLPYAFQSPSIQSALTHHSSPMPVVTEWPKNRPVAICHSLSPAGFENRTMLVLYQNHLLIPCQNRQDGHLDEYVAKSSPLRVARVNRKLRHKSDGKSDLIHGVCESQLGRSVKRREFTCSCEKITLSRYIKVPLWR